MIKFGTDGWCATISDEFTFANIRRIAKAVAVYLIHHGFSDRPLIIGYDARFLAERFAEEAVMVMEVAGINSYLVERDTPEPVVEWEVMDRQAAGALIIAGRTRPPEQNCIRFVPGRGLPPITESAKEIETYLFFEKSRIVSNMSNPVLLAYQEALAKFGRTKGKVERFEPRLRYLKYISSLVDEAVIRRAKLKVVVDPMFGSGRGYLDKLLQDLGCRVEEIHNYRDVLFGGKSPNPIEENLGDLKAKVAEDQADLGIALDGSACSFAAVSKDGKIIPADNSRGCGMQGALLLVEKLAREKV